MVRILIVLSLMLAMGVIGYMVGELTLHTERAKIVLIPRH